MTKADIVRQIAESTGLTKTDVAMVVEGVLDVVRDALERGDRIEIRKFGVFKVVDRAPRMARNPRTGEEVPLPRRRAPSFVPSKHLRVRIK